MVSPLCASPPFSTLNGLLRHIRVIHTDDTSFNIQCNLQGCSRTFKTYRTHIYTYHNTTSLELTSEQCGLEPMEEDEEHEHDWMHSELDSEGYEASHDEVQGKYLLHMNQIHKPHTFALFLESNALHFLNFNTSLVHAFRGHLQMKIEK